MTQDSQSESNERVNFIERMDLSHYSSLVLKMGVRGAGSSLVPKRANCQVLEFFQDLSLGLGHGLQTPNEGINQRNLKVWADVADKICFGCTYKFGIRI